MQTLPSTELKTWVLVPAKKEWDAIYVTTAQMEAISRAWKNNVMAELRNHQGNLVEVLYRTDWRPRPIKVDHNEEKEKGARKWICDYGTRHPMHVGIKTDEKGEKYWSSECDCPSKFKVSCGDFIQWCRLQFKISYPHEVRAYMQEEFLRIRTIS